MGEKIMKQGSEHPYVFELKNQFQGGQITRRDFIRNATLLGMSAAAAINFGFDIKPIYASNDQPKRGGVWKCSMKLQRIDHPSRVSWNQGGNIIKMVYDFLTETGPDNITRPMLVEKWQPSADLKTWDLFIRRGVKFNNGDELTSEDVMFTIKQWFNKEIGSSMFGLLTYWGGFQNVEKVDDYHIRLHLQTPNIAVAEHLYNYPGVILHRSFEGDFVKQPIGTGPFLMSEFKEGERASFQARKDYWMKGADGKPLPYVDQVMYIDMDVDAGMAAINSGQLDSMFRPRPGDIEAAKKNSLLQVISVDTAWTYTVKMRIDGEPWQDNRVRKSLKMCLDRAKILNLAAYGEGTLGIDAHVAPANPEWCPKPIPKYEPDKAKAIMQEWAKEKGISLPIKVTLSTKNDHHDPEIAQAVKELAKPAGFEIALDITEPKAYWSRWTEVPFGVTSWLHRPLATMVLPMAYTKASIGAWNETRWHDDEFDKYLEQANMTLDIKERVKIMCNIEDIMQERGPVGISYWLKCVEVMNKKVKNVKAHPSQYNTFVRDMWLDS
jgi:peptide/nickel transport system substrate-binding protein